MFIYKLTNIHNNKIYIGLTTEKSIAERCRKRIAEAKYRKERNSYILNAIRKYGEESFKVEQIDTAENLEQLKEKEIYYISLYKSTNRNIGYNLSTGGEGSKGVIRSKETRDKIRQKALGRIRSEESKKRQSKSLKESNNLFLQGKENFKLYNLKTSKKIQKFDIFGNLVNTYNSLSETVKENNLNRSSFSRYLNKKCNKKLDYKGFIYKFLY